MTAARTPARPDPRDLEVFHRVCSACRKPVMWPRSVATGDLMPVDAEPTPGGNVLCRRSDDDPRRLVCDVIGRKATRAAMAEDGWPMWVHHRLSCPKADEWARQPKHRRPQPTGLRPAPTPTAAPEPEGLF